MWQVALQKAEGILVEDDKGAWGQFVSTVRGSGALISFGRPDGVLLKGLGGLGGGDIALLGVRWGVGGRLE